MSGSLRAWYSLRDLEMLGGRQGELDGELELSSLPRLAGLLNSTAGSVRATLLFRQRGLGAVAATLSLETTVELLCQRCLEPFAQPIDERIELVLVEPDASSASIPEGYEPVELDNGRLMPARLIEDELIVSIPLVPKHARIEDCGSLARKLTG
ncbi:MAG TPA: YceD family protein [Gammaproteobacteria bacterium]|nr:YceD family protein [Gammaproteobacteria bacterium]